MRTMVECTLWGVTAFICFGVFAVVVWICWQSVQPPLNTTVIYKDQSRMTALCAVEYPPCICTPQPCGEE